MVHTIPFATGKPLDQLYETSIANEVRICPQHLYNSPEFPVVY